METIGIIILHNLIVYSLVLISVLSFLWRESIAPYPFSNSIFFTHLETTSAVSGFYMTSFLDLILCLLQFSALKTTNREISADWLQIPKAFQTLFKRGCCKFSQRTTC